MITQAIDKNNIYCLIMKRAELEDLIRAVRFFSDTEVELKFKPKWRYLLDDLEDVRRQQQLSFTDAELNKIETDAEDLK